MASPKSISKPTPEELAARGFHLFPCKGKKPLVKWSRESTTDLSTISLWAKQFPGCSWGVDCGKSGLLVLDDDRGKNPDAEESLFQLELNHAPLPQTFTVRTPSHGYHYYYTGTGRNSASSKLGKGLDTRGVGGYVIAPCSEGYEIEARGCNGGTSKAIAAPDWLVRLVGGPAKTEKIGGAEGDPPGIDGSDTIRRGIAFLKSASPSVEGNGGNDHTYHVACRVRDMGVSEGAAFALMEEHFNDRCEPPWKPQELEVIIANAYSYAQNKQIGVDSPQAVFTEFIDTAPSRFKILTRDDVLQFPPYEWLVKGIIPTKGLFQVYGPSTSGKSFLMFEMLAAIAEGREWFGYKTKQRNVLLVSLEGEAGLRQRVEAWEKHNGRHLPPNFKMMAQPWSIIKKQDIIDLAEAAKDADIIVIDTQNRAAPSIKETTSEDMGAVLEGAKALGSLIDGVVGLVAHTGKDASKGSRGHSSQLPTMDAAIEVSRDGDLREWKTAKVKDGRDDKSAKFKLQEVVLGTDEDGEEITSCVVSEAIIEGADTDGFDLNESEAAAWSSVKFLSSSSRSGEVANSAWKAEFEAQLGLAPSKNSANRYYKARDGLLRKHLVAKQNGLYVVSALTEVDT